VDSAKQLVALVFLILLISICKPIVAETSFYVVVEPGAVFYLEDYGTEVRVASTLYAEEINVYGNKVEFIHAGFDQAHVLNFTIGVINANLTLTSILDKKVKLISQAPSGTLSKVVICSDYGKPVYVKIHGSYVRPFNSRSEFEAAAYDCWYYDTSSNLVYIKAVAHSNITIEVSWKEEAPPKEEVPKVEHPPSYLWFAVVFAVIIVAASLYVLYTVKHTVVKTILRHRKFVKRDE